MKRVLLSWSSGKDSAWALHVLRQDPSVRVEALLTTFNDAADRVAMHAVRRNIVTAQADAAGLPLWPVGIPSPCPNDVYEARMRAAVAGALSAGITHIAFGDLFLEDVRRYREDRLAGTGIAPMFPLWGRATSALAREMLDAGLDAVVTCVDPSQLDAAFAGRRFDASLLSDLPASADPCGERGEFHTCCVAGPMFSRAVPVTSGERVTRDGFVFCDVMLRDLTP
ncbi:MAG: ATP-binding protein [Vicinamibacterales bacterium]